MSATASNGMPESGASEIRYQTEGRTSQFKVRVFAGGLLSAFGHSPTIAIRNFFGEVRADPNQLDRSFVKVTVQAASLSVADDVSDKDRKEIESRMRDEVLETGQYPEIVYEGSHVSANRTGEGQYQIVVKGHLSLHGIVREQVVPAKVIIDGDMVRAFGEFSILQSDYGIKPVSAAGGAVKVKDELKFVFNIIARRQG